VEIDGEVYIARQIDIRNPSARGASTLYKIRFFNVRDGKKLEQTLKSDEFVKHGDLTRRAVQYSYSEGEMVTFMDVEDYSQYTLNADSLGEQTPYMTEDLEGMTPCWSTARSLLSKFHRVSCWKLPTRTPA